MLCIRKNNRNRRCCCCCYTAMALWGKSREGASMLGNDAPKPSSPVSLWLKWLVALTIVNLVGIAICFTFLIIILVNGDAMKAKVNAATADLAALENVMPMIGNYLQILVNLNCGQ